METQIGPLGRPSSQVFEQFLFSCNICLVPKPEDFFPFLPCCSRKLINRDACAACVATALTEPTDNKCPRCREYVQLISTAKSEKPPHQIVDARIQLGAIETCLSCGEKRRLIHPSEVCKGCQRVKDKALKGLLPKISYECQVCHQEQSIPFPIYKTQPTPRNYGNPAWWSCNNACGGKFRKWRIVERDVDKLEKGSAPHSWAQYFVRKNLNCLPDDPAKITTETKLRILQDFGHESISVDVGSGRFAVDETDATGHSFLVPCDQFPIVESLEDDNDERFTRKTTLRIMNERSQQIHAILAHWLPNGFVRCQLIASTANKSINNKPENDAESDSPFLEEDWLVAMDYLPLLSSQDSTQAPVWSRQEFSILRSETMHDGSITPYLGWNVQPYNVRIGKIGICVGEKEKMPTEDEVEEEELDDQEGDIILEINVENPVTALWTDAVHLSVSLHMSTGTESSDSDEDLQYPIQLLPDDKHPSIRHFPSGKPLQGSLMIQFSSVSFKSLIGLASPDYGGGLHLALLAPSAPPLSDDVVVAAAEPPDLIDKPSFTVEELQASAVTDLRNKIREMTMNEKRYRLMHMIVDESHKEQLEKNILGGRINTLLEPMLENEDFVRRYMQSSRNFEEDEFGWVDPDTKEDTEYDSEEDENPSMTLGSQGSRLVVKDPAKLGKTGWFSSTARAMRDSFVHFTTSNERRAVPATNLVTIADDVDGGGDEPDKPDKPDSAIKLQHIPTRARVQMDGIHKEVL
ncbi:MAG: hypothetical protein SGBAC_010495 [Bacillariaceae sp.]